MWQVKLSKGNVNHTFTYTTQAAAESYAAIHRSTGYYEVSVSKA